uniref:Uncharacterized protein n=1 Tax=Eutreptiella gymnastica TaxID=73025 RepID=A0A7S4CUJ6_9EUGL
MHLKRSSTAKEVGSSTTFDVQTLKMENFKRYPKMSVFFVLRQSQADPNHTDCPNPSERAGRFFGVREHTTECSVPKSVVCTFATHTRTQELVVVSKGARTSRK